MAAGSELVARPGFQLYGPWANPGSAGKNVVKNYETLVYRSAASATP